MKNPDTLQARAKALHLHGLLAHWSEAAEGRRIRRRLWPYLCRRPQPCDPKPTAGLAEPGSRRPH